MRARLVRRIIDHPELGIYMLGFSTLLFGIACSLQRDFTIYWQPVPESFPFRQPLAFVSAALLVISGLALFFPRTRRVAVIVQVFLFFAYAVSWFSRPMPWLGIAEHLSIMVGAVTIWARLAPVPILLQGLVAVPARVIFGCCSIVFGLSHVIGLKGTTSLIPAWMPGDAVFWALFTGAAHIGVGLALIVNRLAVPATRLAGLMYLCFAAIVWLPGALTHPDQWLRWAGFAITLTMLAAVWLVGDYLRPRAFPASA